MAWHVDTDPAPEQKPAWVQGVVTAEIFPRATAGRA